MAFTTQEQQPMWDEDELIKQYHEVFGVYPEVGLLAFIPTHLAAQAAEHAAALATLQTRIDDRSKPAASHATFNGSG